MSDNLGIKIEVDVQSGIKIAENQLDNFIKKYSGKEIKLNIDTGSLKNFTTQIETINKNLNNMGVDNLNSGLSKISQTYKGLSSTITKQVEVFNDGIGKTTKVVNDLDKATGLLKTSSKTVTNDYQAQQKILDAEYRQEQKISDQINSRLNKTVELRKKADRSLELKQSQSINRNLDAEYRQVQKISNQYESLRNRLDRMGSSAENNVVFKRNPHLQSTLDTLNKDLSNANIKLKDGTMTSKEWAGLNLHNRVNKLSTQLDVASNKMSKFTTTILANFKAFANWYLIGNVIAGVSRSIKNGFGTIKELDASMTELKKVTDDTKKSYEEFYHAANKTAKDLAITTKAVMDATVMWSQMGYKIQDATELAKSSAIFSNISENMNIEDATSTIISTMKAFGLGTDQVLDGIASKVNSVGNSFSVTNSGIAEGLKESSSAMASANNTLDQTIALLTAGRHTCPTA